MVLLLHNNHVGDVETKFTRSASNVISLNQQMDLFWSWLKRMEVHSLLKATTHVHNLGADITRIKVRRNNDYGKGG